MFDTIKNAFYYQPKPIVKLEARNAFVTAGYVKMKYLKLGLSWHRKFKMGVGYAWMKTDISKIVARDTTQLNFGYALLFAEYNFYQSKHWNLEIPVHMGIGRISYKTNDYLTAKKWVPIWEPAMTFEYNFLRYFGVGFGAGYRLIIKNKVPIIEQFTSPIYIFKFKISFGDIYKDVKKKIDQD